MGSCGSDVILNEPIYVSSTEYAYVLKEKDALKKDSGYFADPARQSEVGFYSGAKPSPWSLLKQGRIGAASSFYPTFFWKTRRLGLMYVLLNSARKEGLKYGVELLLEYFYWMEQCFI